MTQQHIFDNSKYAIDNSFKHSDVFCFGAHKLAESKFLELPSTLKNIGDSDIDIYIYDKMSNEDLSNDEELKSDMNKSKNECFQNNTSNIWITK